MNIAYLILAHHQPAHLRRLLAALDTDNAYFFVHVDAKVDSAPFTIGARNDVFFWSDG